MALSHHQCGERQKMIVESVNDNISGKVQFNLESEGTVEQSYPGRLQPYSAIGSPLLW